MKELLNEFITDILRVSEATANDINQEKLTYTDANGKTRTVQVITVRNAGKKHPAWPQYQAWLRSHQKQKSKTEPVAKTKQGKTHNKQPSKPVKSDTDTVSTTGATIYTTPPKTPAGNEINVEFKPEYINNINNRVTNEINSRVSKNDSLSDTIDLPRYRKRHLSSNSDYYTKHSITNPQLISGELKTTLLSAGVPQIHIDMLERAINTETDGDNPPFSKIVGTDVGKGKPESQAGELMALIFMALPTEDRESVSTSIKTLIAGTKIENTTLNSSWVNAGIHQALAFDSMMNSKYGKNNWKVETIAWDVPADIEGIGLAEKDKGFSTDGAIRIRVNNKAKVVRLSLKKNSDVFLFNGTTNDIIAAALGVDKYKNVTQAKINEIENESLRTAIQTIVDFQREQNESAISLVKSISGLPPISSSEVDNNKQDELAIAVHGVLRTLEPTATEQDIKAALKNIGIKNSAQAIKRAIVLAAELESRRNDSVSKLLDEHKNITKKCIQATFDIAIESPTAMEKLMFKLEETFPIYAIASGHEFMCLGGIPFSQQTCQQLFGTIDMNEIQKGLRIVTKPGPPPESMLIYTGKGPVGKELPIAIVRPREKGIGFRGVVGLEFKATPLFACAAAKANKNIEQTNSVNDEIANSKICNK